MYKALYANSIQKVINDTKLDWCILCNIIDFFWCWFSVAHELRTQINFWLLNEWKYNFQIIFIVIAHCYFYKCEWKQDKKKPIALDCYGFAIVWISAVFWWAMNLQPKKPSIFEEREKEHLQNSIMILLFYLLIFMLFKCSCLSCSSSRSIGICRTHIG